MVRRVRHTCFFFFQAEDGIRDLVRSRGLGDVYKRQQEQLDGEVGQQPTIDDAMAGQRPTQIVAPLRLPHLSLIHI